MGDARAEKTLAGRALWQQRDRSTQFVADNKASLLFNWYQFNYTSCSCARVESCSRLWETNRADVDLQYVVRPKITHDERWSPLRLNLCSFLSVNELPKSTTPHLTPFTLLKTSASYLMNTSPSLTRSHLSPNAIRPTDWAPTVLVSLQPIKSWRWRGPPVNASCNWVDLLHDTSVHFSLSAVNTTLLSHCRRSHVTYT